MPRPLRVEYAGACYHVINRGNYRQRIFGGKGAAEAFERTLGEAADRFGWELGAYVIMSNHFHLAVQLGEPNLSEGMKWLQGTWVRRFNRYRNWTGRPFQGRYKGILVEPGHVYGQVCHYIHLNPLRAKLESEETIGDYRWSSLHWLGKRRCPRWLDGSVVLEEAGGLTDTPAGWRNYRRYLAWMGTDNRERKRLMEAKLSRGWCKGSKDFRKSMWDEAKQRGADWDRVRFEGLDPAELNKEREVRWEEQLEEVASIAKIDLENLPLGKMAEPKAILAAAMKRATSVSNGWLAERLEMGSAATVSQAAQRVVLKEESGQEVEKLVGELRVLR
ncbi:MAG: transposase [Verrucomicrobiota bacterium]